MPRPGMLGMQGYNSYDHKTTAVHETSTPPPPPSRPNKHAPAAPAAVQAPAESQHSHTKRLTTTPPPHCSFLIAPLPFVPAHNLTRLTHRCFWSQRRVPTGAYLLFPPSLKGGKVGRGGSGGTGGAGEEEAETEELTPLVVKKYACQRPTPMRHHNEEVRAVGLRVFE